jgi:hypothetical protein
LFFSAIEVGFYNTCSNVIGLPHARLLEEKSIRNNRKEARGTIALRANVQF